MSKESSDCPTIKFGDKSIKLEKSVLHRKLCEWRLSLFSDDVWIDATKDTPFDSLNEGIDNIVNAVELPSETVRPNKIIEMFNYFLSNVISPLMKLTESAKVTITKILFNRKTKQLLFGIAVKLTKETKIGPVKIDGVALLVKVKPKDSGTD